MNEITRSCVDAPNKHTIHVYTYFTIYACNERVILNSFVENSRRTNLDGRLRRVNKENFVRCIKINRGIYRGYLQRYQQTKDEEQ